MAIQRHRVWQESVVRSCDLVALQRPIVAHCDLGLHRLTADWSRQGLTVNGGALSGNWASPFYSPALL